MNRRLKKKIWLCSDVWMDILPSFDRPQLGLKMALLSPRFDALVDTHFDGKMELTIWRRMTIREGIGPEAKVSVWIDGKFVEFPFPDRPLPNKICFKNIRIDYIDHSVIEFLRANKKNWDRIGTNLGLSIAKVQLIWDVFTHEIWPVFATNIRHLRIDDGQYLDNLRRRTSPTLLTDLDHLNSINTDILFPDAIGDDFNGPNASAGQSLSKWLHIPTKDGQPKRLFCEDLDEEGNVNWVNSFKEVFLRATNSSVSYKINFVASTNSIEGPFELVNERTKEKLILEKVPRYNADDEFISDWLMKRCPISEKAAAVQWENDENWDDKLNKVTFHLWGGSNCIGPLSPPAEEENEEADKSNEN